MPQDDHSERCEVTMSAWIIDIEEAKYLDGYKIHLTFSDGSEQTVDFESFLNNSHNPMIRKHLDINAFKNFTVAYGDLFWNDYDLCFPIADLYWGKI